MARKQRDTKRIICSESDATDMMWLFEQHNKINFEYSYIYH